MKEKLFKWLFPEKSDEIEDLFNREIQALKDEQKWKLSYRELLEKKEKSFVDNKSIEQSWQDKTVNLRKQIGSLQLQLNKAKKFDVADLMRQTLGLVPFVEFAELDQGYPPHYLLSGRAGKVARLATIAKDPVFKEMVDYLINVQGNFSLRNAKNDIEFWSGRFSINGISKIWDELQKANAEYEESIKKDEEKFDENAL